MKRIILLSTIIILVVMSFVSSSYAQSCFFKYSNGQSVTKYRDHSGDLIDDDSGSTTLIVVGAVAVAAAVTYWIISSSGDDTEKSGTEDSTTDETSMNIDNSSGLTYLVQKTKPDLESINSPISFYIASQANYMNSNSTNYSFGVQYNF